jgi:hypothetical protein
MSEAFTIKERLLEQFACSGNSWLGGIKSKVVQSFGVDKPFWARIMFDNKGSEGVIIHDDSFVVPVIAWHNVLNLTNWRKCFFEEKIYNCRILGIKTSMLGGEVQGIYQKRNKEVIEQVGFKDLFKKEQVILTMMINRAVGKGVSNGYIKPLGYECIAKREFQLFLCGEKYQFNRDDIINARYKCSQVFNCTQNNDLDKDKFHFVGVININEVDRLHRELRGSFS